MECGLSKASAARHNRYSHQLGIALGPILFILAVLAILAAVIAAGTGGFSSDTSSEKAHAYASAIVDYATNVYEAVQNVRSTGCDDTQISFENSMVSGYVNPNAPSDKHCHVFNMAGGSMLLKQPPAGALDATYSSQTIYGNYFFVGGNNVCGIGGSYAWPCATSNCPDPATCGELLIMVPFVSLAVCQQIMSITQGTTTVPQIPADFSLMKFGGDYNNGGNPGKEIYGTGITSRTSGCFQGYGPLWGTTLGSGVGTYHFWAVLVAR